MKIEAAAAVVPTSCKWPQTLVASKCVCPAMSHWEDSLCKPNSLYCKDKKYVPTTGSCTECAWGYEKKKVGTIYYCTQWKWWVWFLLALLILVASLLLTMLFYGIFWIAQKFCGCCKQKKTEKKPLVKHEETHVHAAPPPRQHYVHHEPVVHHHEPQYVSHHHHGARVEYGEPRITYGETNVIEHKGSPQHSHVERRHVETRQLSPDRTGNVVLYNDQVDWAKESRVKYGENRVVQQSGRNGSHVQHGGSRVVRQEDHNQQYNPFAN